MRDDFDVAFVIDVARLRIGETHDEVLGRDRWNGFRLRNVIVRDDRFDSHDVGNDRRGSDLEDPLGRFDLDDHRLDFGHEGRVRERQHAANGSDGQRRGWSLGNSMSARTR